MVKSSQPVILSEAKDPAAKNMAAHGFFASLRMTAAGLVGLPARAASGLVWVYQRTLSPALTAAFPLCGCRFAPTCSHYARAALQEHGFLAGTALTATRLARCGPWHPGGLDPVPPSRRQPVCARVHHA